VRSFRRNSGCRANQVLACLLILSAAPLLLHAQTGAIQDRVDAKLLESRLRELEKEIEAVRGLKFKMPVKAEIIPRPADTDKKLQGFYNTKDKRLYLYNDISGNYERGVLIHEMVHALQDQHFGLAKLHQTAFGSDAELARAALIEGDASYTMIEVLKKDQPKVVGMLVAPLEKSKNLQNAFLYAQGARYVKALKERGGWETVNNAYRFPGGSTAAVLHPDERISAINLGPGNTQGELALIKMFLAHPATKGEAFAAAAGWRGDREIVDGDAKSSVVAFARPEQAMRFAQALRKLRAGEKKLTSQETPDSTVWRGAFGVVRAILVRRERVLTIDAPDSKSYVAMLDRVEGPLSLRVYAKKEKQFISFGQMIDQLLAAEVVCVGETHDSDLHHRVQLQIVKALHACDERLGVGLEMFQRPFQKEIDRYFRGEIGEDDFLSGTEYKKRWGYEWGLYRPIVEFCRKNAIPLAALNVTEELRKRVSKVGYENLTAEEKKDLGPVDFHVKEHRDYFLERLVKLHGKDQTTKERMERGYQVMTVWDDYMASSAALFQKERQLRRFVVLAGSGHIDHGFGIPLRVARRGGASVLTVNIQVGNDTAKATSEPVADYIVFVK
jgi:uncharacterized iron-regulated protein